MDKNLITKLLAEKNNMSYVIFDHEFKIIDYNESFTNIADNKSNIATGVDVREVMWEFVGIEEQMLALFNATQEKDKSIHFPMIVKDTNYYDLDINIFQVSDIQKAFISYITKKSEYSISYIRMIQEINKKTLIFNINKSSVVEKENYYNLINKKFLSFNVDLDGIITRTNEIFSYFFDLETDKIVGNHFSNFFKTREFSINGENSLVLNAVDNMGKDTSFHADIIPLEKSGQVYENLIICQDRRYLKHLETNLEYASGFDSLTGLPNRSPLLKQIDESIIQNEKDKKYFAICFVDIENFTKVNEEYGYHAGDMLLKHTANILSDFVRKEDMVARIGGDEFVILIDNLDTKESINATIERIETLPSNNKLRYSEEDIIEFNFVLGLSFYPNDSKDSSELIEIAKKQTKQNKKIK